MSFTQHDKLNHPPPTEDKIQHIYSAIKYERNIASLEELHID